MNTNSVTKTEDIDNNKVTKPLPPLPKGPDVITIDECKFSLFGSRRKGDN